MDYISEDQFYEMAMDRFGIDADSEFLTLNELDVDYSQMQEFLYMNFVEGQVYEGNIASVRDNSTLFSIYSTVFR